jgi:uncharacterized membrane protein
VYPQRVAESVELRPLTKPPVRATLRHRHRRRDGVLVGVDRARLVDVARRAGAMIELTAPIGAQVGDDAPILQVRGDRPMDRRVVLRCLMFADGQRVPQDPAFAIRCIVDVAIRALLAAINDPTSAVEEWTLSRPCRCDSVVDAWRTRRS